MAEVEPNRLNGQCHDKDGCRLLCRFFIMNGAFKRAVPGIGIKTQQLLTDEGRQLQFSDGMELERVGVGTIHLLFNLRA